MVDVGIQANFVDTQDAVLTNNTDGLTYRQLTDLIFDIDNNVTKHQLTDDTIDNVFSLRMTNLQGNMWVTNPEWAELLQLLTDVDGVRPTKGWDLTWTDQSNMSIMTAFHAQMKTLRPIDSGIGAVKLFFRLEGKGDETVVMPT